MNKFQTLAKEVYGTLATNQELELAKKVVLECVELINAHAANMEKYNFHTKAQTADTCARILLEHFNLKDQGAIHHED